MEDTKKTEALTDAEREAIYQRAIGYLGSSLTNDELFEESLNALLYLGEYKDAEALYQKYRAQYLVKREATATLAKKRKASRIFQGVMVGLGFGAVLLLILILVYALKLDIVR